MSSTWLFALLGGAMIGGAAALLLLVHGRIAGISGVVGGLLPPHTGERVWRVAFVAGLLGAGAAAAIVAPHAIGASVRSTGALMIAGLLVGFGTRLGSGCTSGHGVCGLSRFSVRSAAAVLVFMAAGAITASIAGSVS
jgi:uncharacterized protein